MVEPSFFDLFITSYESVKAVETHMLAKFVVPFVEAAEGRPLYIGEGEAAIATKI